MIHFCLSLGGFGNSNFKIPVKFVDISMFFGLNPNKIYR